MGESTQVFWRFLVMAIVGLATAKILAELIYAIRHLGSQYILVNKLAPGIYLRGLFPNTAMLS